MLEDSLLIWIIVAFAVISIGVLVALYTKRMPALPMFACLIPICSVVAYVGHVSLRVWVVAPALIALCGYFGLSCGYLLCTDRHIGYEAMVGKRFLLSKSSTVLSTVTMISIMGVSLGVWLVLISLGVLAGFEHDLQQKIIGANAHVVLQQDNTKPFKLEAHVLQTIDNTPGVVAAAPFVETEVAIASTSNYSGALLFGINPEQSSNVLDVLHQHDKLVLPDNSNIPALMIGVELAKILNVGVGDYVRIISPSLEILTPFGMAPKSLGFYVASIFSSKMYEYDARYVYTSLAAVRRFLELDTDWVSGVHMRCKNPARSQQLGARLIAQLGNQHLVALDWKQRNENLFAALKLERAVAFVVLAFIILVASFSIVNTLTMSVIEKKREIAILKTLGAHDVGMMKLFLVQGLLVGGIGTLCGVLAGIVTMKFLERFGFGIPGEVYYIDSLPVKLDMSDVVLVVCAAVLIVWDFSIYPSLAGARIQPVEGLRDR